MDRGLRFEQRLSNPSISLQVIRTYSGFGND